MRICFVTSGDLEEFSRRGWERKADVICFSFQALGEVSYERELKGETALFEDVALLSRATESVVLCGCYTDARWWPSAARFWAYPIWSTASTAGNTAAARG